MKTKSITLSLPQTSSNIIKFEGEGRLFLHEECNIDLIAHLPFDEIVSKMLSDFDDCCRLDTVVSFNWEPYNYEHPFDAISYKELIAKAATASVILETGENRQFTMMFTGISQRRNEKKTLNISKSILKTINELLKVPDPIWFYGNGKSSVMIYFSNPILK